MKEEYLPMRPQSLHSSYRFYASSGISLMELGLVMAIVALALVPMVKSIGGPMSDSGKGATSQITGSKNKEAILASNLANQVLGGDYSSLTCGKGTREILPNNGKPEKYRKCETDQPLKSEWTVMKITKDNSGNEPPDGYSYYKGILNIYDEKATNRDEPLLTMPINFYEYEKPQKDEIQKAGVLIALDRSGSMAWGSSRIGMPPDVDMDDDGKRDLEVDKPKAFALPFLWYRYKDFPKPGVTVPGWNYSFPAVTGPAAQPLDMWNNETLDLVSVQNMKGKNGDDPNLGTPYNESYMGSNSMFKCNMPANSPAWIAGKPGFDKRLAYIFNREWVLTNDAISDYTRKNYIIPLCEEKNNGKDWSTIVNTKLSRYEAARTAALSLLLKLEERPSVVEAIKVGYFPWAPYPAVGQGGPLQPAVIRKDNKGNSHLVFDVIREKMLWLNRMDPTDRTSPHAVNLQGGTNIHGALEEARRQLLADSGIQRRILVLMTDGEPAPNKDMNNNGEYGSGGLRDYTKKYLGCGAPKDKRITLFTVGFIEADEKLMNDMAEDTPHGQGFFAKDISSLGPIFDSVAYEIQKLALLGTADRYGLDLSNDEDACGT